jgi:hypothetical protein
MHLQELASRGEEGLDIPPSAISMLDGLLEQTESELQGASRLLSPSFYVSRAC